jgi:DNA (cytosine-5)-methyltransferase 1
LENVAAILNNGLGIVLGELAEAGFDCEYACIPASALGACHRRDRWWLVGKLANSDGKRMERRIEPINQEMQKTRLAWQSDTPHLSPEWRSYVSEPVLRRGDDGLSKRMDRLRCLGNSVLPQVAAIPLQRVLNLANE